VRQSSLDAGSKQQKEKDMKVRSNHNSLLNYFLYEEKDLSRAYVKKCQTFIDNLGSRKLADCMKMQASSGKPQALIQKNLHKPGTRVKNRFNRKV
jgi:hypothetical protein